MFCLLNLCFPFLSKSDCSFSKIKIIKIEVCFRNFRFSILPHFVQKATNSLQTLNWPPFPLALQGAAHHYCLYSSVFSGLRKSCIATDKSLHIPLGPCMHCLPAWKPPFLSQIRHTLRCLGKGDEEWICLLLPFPYCTWETPEKTLSEAVLGMFLPSASNCYPCLVLTQP